MKTPTVASSPFRRGWPALIVLIFSTVIPLGLQAATGVGVPPPPGSEVLFDGRRETLDAKWTYWEGPAFISSLPINWLIIDDPVDEGHVLKPDDPIRRALSYGMADLITKEAHRDFRLHVEFLVLRRGGDSGIYLQNRYEIQILDGGRGNNGTGAVMGETQAPAELYRGLNAWNAFDIHFRAARFKGGQLTERALVTLYFNGVKVFANHACQRVWGGPKSGLDGGNRNGLGLTDTPAGIKLQGNSRDVCFRNIWIAKVEFDGPNTDIEP